MNDKSDEFVVTFTTGAGDVLRHVDEMLSDARHWVTTAECLATYEVPTMTKALWRELQERIARMELSFHRSLLWLLKMAGQSGEMRISWDSERSLFWHEPKSGFHGGLIFHPKYVKSEPTPIGEWSLHT